MTRTVAIVPMRHNSERVVGKNYRPLAGKPLFHHVLEMLLSVPQIDEIVIDTDSQTILDDASQAFPSVTLLRRPEHLRDGAIAMNEVLKNTLSQIDADVVLQTHSTNPFLRADTVSEALQKFNEQNCDSVFSVTRLQARLWEANGQPLNHDPAFLLRTQDLAPLFIENSCFFIFTPALLQNYGTRIGPRALMVEMSANEAIDLDIEDDFALAVAMAQCQGTGA